MHFCAHNGSGALVKRRSMQEFVHSKWIKIEAQAGRTHMTSGRQLDQLRLQVISMTPCDASRISVGECVRRGEPQQWRRRGRGARLAACLPGEPQG